MYVKIQNERLYKGLFIINSQHNLLTNPLRVDSPDPFMTWCDGYYYYMCTERTKIVLYRSKRVSEIFSGEHKTVYEAGNEVKSCLWAPELHKVDGKWYIYSSGCTEGEDYRSIRMFCLEAQGDSPFSDYIFKGFTDSDIYAIDQTVFHNDFDGKDYNVFVQIRKETGNTVMIGEMENPWTIGKKRAVLKHTEFDWEKKQGRVCEGPFILKHCGRTFLIYSANDTFSPYYCLGIMEYMGGDPLDGENWRHFDKPFFREANGVYSVGHASTFLSPDGTEYWLCYHGNKCTEAGKYDRSTYIQKFTFTKDGLPDFGEPIKRGQSFECPSGEK